MGPSIISTQPTDSVDHGFEIRGTVHVPEAIPRQPRGQPFESFKEPKACNRFLWSAQLEEEQLAVLERAKSATTMWLPKVDLVHALARAQKGVPIGISQREVTLHCVHQGNVPDPVELTS